MKTVYLFTLLAFALPSSLFGQNGVLIDYVGSTRDNSAILDVQSANNGALEQSNADHPEQGMFKSDFGGAELIEKRTEYSKTYRNPDGSCGEKSGSIPMHFKHAKENCLLIIKNFINKLHVFFNAAEANNDQVKLDIEIHKANHKFTNRVKHFASLCVLKIAKT